MHLKSREISGIYALKIIQEQRQAGENHAAQEFHERILERKLVPAFAALASLNEKTPERHQLRSV
jgi:hypothetical protein